jgi:transcriptional regulator with XRE-family HTH domain
MSFSDIAGRLRQQSDSAGQTGDSPRNFDELYLLRARILGVLIRDAREAADMSQAECAARIGVAAAQLEQWELGHAMPSLPQLELIAYTLNLPISHFWGTQTLQRRAEQGDIDAAEYTVLRGKLLGGLLRAARERQNLTPEQLAEVAGVTASQILSFEMGRQPIPVPILVTLAQVCQVSLAYFLDDGNRISRFLNLQEDLKNFAELPEDVRHFVASPVNQSYIELAMRLSQMSTGELRGIAEAILNITL